jgi:predicted metal-dependent TIM-barrel fold hydrolase
MRIIETSLYTSQRPARDLRELAASGVVAIVEPMTYAGLARRYADTYMDEFERLLVAEPRRCAEFGIEHLSLLGVPALDASQPDAAHRALDRLGAFLGRTGCVGIGEVGFEEMTHEEERLLRRQARMARETGLPFVIQAPSSRSPQGVARSLQIAAQEQVRPERTLVKGVDGQTLSLVLQAGAWAGLTLHPRFLSADDALRLIARHGLDRLMLQSDAGRGYGDHLAVPAFARRLRNEGLSEKETERLTYHNPKWFFSQGLGLDQSQARERVAAI